MRLRRPAPRALLGAADRGQTGEAAGAIAEAVARGKSRRTPATRRSLLAPQNERGVAFESLYGPSASCGCALSVERAADPLHGARVNAKASCNLAYPLFTIGRL